MDDAINKLSTPGTGLGDRLLARQRDILLDAFNAAIARSLPIEELRRHLPDVPRTCRLVLLAAGKAAAHMASVAEAHYVDSGTGGRIEGLVVSPDDTSVQFQKLKHIRGGHPYPDASSEVAASRMIESVRGLKPGDQVLMLLSGGASSLLCAPADGISFARKRKITKMLLRAGVSIEELNTVRKFLSAIKGGRLARLAAPACVTTLAISDVVGDDPAIIGSAPTFESPSNLLAARLVFARHGIPEPPELDQVAQLTPELPLANDGGFILIARPSLALEAAARVARNSGYAVRILGDNIEGEARTEAEKMARLVLDAAGNEQPQALLSGGEVTVNLGATSGHVYGGPNREFALALAAQLPANPPVTALIADTDGVDGDSGPDGPVAGAFVDGKTVAKANSAKIDPAKFLERHDSGTFFATIGDEVVTGPTGTNVNDFRMVLIR